MSSAAKTEAASTAGAQTVAKVSPRRMHYPYTLTAKFIQFPWKFYYQKSPIAKYYVFGIILSFPLFWKFQKMSRSPENIQKWKEIRAHQASHPKPWDI